MKLVVAYDGSDHARRALERAAELATGNDEVLIVGVVEAGRWAYSGAEGQALPQHHHLDAAQRDKNFEAASALLAQRGIEAESVAAFGDAGAAILDVAKDADADLIVVGSRGRNRAERLLLGSVSSKVVHRAPCDVLVVRGAPQDT